MADDDLVIAAITLCRAAHSYRTHQPLRRRAHLVGVSDGIPPGDVLRAGGVPALCATRQPVGCCQETGSEAPRSMSGSRYITRCSAGTDSRARCSAALIAAAIWYPWS